MCGIYASFNYEKFNELKKVNSKRGVINESQFITVINCHDIETPYYVGHIQSPTSNSAKKHPASNYYNDSNDGTYNLLWHNGIVKEEYLKQNNVSDMWDTQFILNSIDEYGFSILNDIDGSFACLYQNKNGFYIFRNEISPLYIDDDINISSLKSNNMKMLSANIVYEIKDYKLIERYKFSTKNNPYKL